MDERKGEDRRSDHLKLAPPSLKAAVRRARVEAAEQSEAVDDLRRAELMRLEMLQEAIRPVVEQAPEGVDLFDVGIAHGERPRLFLDMIGFVDLGHDRRTYRFFQDTRHGRVLIAESAQMDRIAQAVTNYVARRLVEREQALASDWRPKPREAAAPAQPTPAAARAEVSKPVVAKPSQSAAAAPKRRALAVVTDVMGFMLMTLGAFTLIACLALAGWLLTSDWGHAMLAARFGAASP